MISLDTNVIVRIVTRDDPQQLAAASKVLQAERLWLCKTVLLETEWVLRYTYELSRESILTVFRRLLGYRRLRVEDRATVLQALRLYREGMDLADALHLASSLPADCFATFNRTLAKRAGELHEGAVPPVELLRSAGA